MQAVSVTLVLSYANGDGGHCSCCAQASIIVIDVILCEIQSRVHSVQPICLHTFN